MCMGGAQSLRRPPILASGVHKKCPEPETVCDFTMGVQRACDVPQFPWGGGCTKPEAVGNFHHGGAQRLRRPPTFVNGMPKKWPEPETVGNFIMGVEKSLRRPTIFVSGMRKKCSEPETVGKFIMGVQKA